MNVTRRLRPVPLAATALTGVTALYLALVVVGNVTDFGTNREFVRHVLAMDTTFKDEDLMWRAITSRPLQDVAYVAIICWEVVSALLLCLATVRWARGIRGGPVESARTGSTWGLVMVLVLFGGGFVGVGGEWFAMWQSEDWNGLDAATRSVVLAGVALLVVHLPLRDERTQGGPRGGERG